MRTKVRWLIIGILLVSGIAYIGGSAYFANVMINNETQTVAEAQQRFANLEYHRANLPPPEAVTIEADTVTLAGFFYDNEADGQCAVLLLHGYRGTRYGVLHLAAPFWDRGCDLLAYDARGHGESSVAYHTYGYHEKVDGQAAYQWLLTKTGLPPAQVGIAGVSYGAATVLQMSPLVPDAAFILADSAYQDLHTIIGFQAVQQFGTWTRFFVPGAFAIAQLRAEFDAGEVSAQNAVAAVDTPILLIHARADSFTLPSHSEAIYAHSNPATTELYITDYGTAHARSILDDYEAYTTLLDAFLAAHVPDFGLSSDR